MVWIVSQHASLREVWCNDGRILDQVLHSMTHVLCIGRIHFAMVTHNWIHHYNGILVAEGLNEFLNLLNLLS